MQKKIVVLFLLLIALLGCAKQYAPEKAEQGQMCSTQNCNEQCKETTYYSGGTCQDGKCVYTKYEEGSEKCGIVKTREVLSSIIEEKYNFDTNLLFCAYDKVFDKYTLFFGIKNTTQNTPQENSKIWLKVSELDYGTVKTVQKEYDTNKIFWEDNTYTYEGTKYRGQSWEIRNITEPGNFKYELIFCDPAAQTKEACTDLTGIVLARGSTFACNPKE